MKYIPKCFILFGARFWNFAKRKRSLFSCLWLRYLSHSFCFISRCAVFCCKFLVRPSSKKPTEMKPESKKLLNIIILGVSFMFLFTAFQTCGNIEVSFLNQILERFHIPSDKTHSFFWIFSANGYQELQQHRVPWEWIHKVKAPSVRHTCFCSVSVLCNSCKVDDNHFRMTTFSCGSMSIIYGVLSAFSLVAPVVVTVIGPQLSMFFSGLMYRYNREMHIAISVKFKPLIPFCVVFM